ncbi:DUF5627 domain-containing protein [Mariniphaga sediminis]|nr:DUF5627 domain-containing protein [Mariniphaga sediminis]
MKRISILFILIVSMFHFSCKDDELRFDDFDYTTVYFPFQYPVRTLVLGDYIFDNANDNDLKFKISARVGGMYENNKDWEIKFQIDQSLVADLITNENDWDGKSESSADTLKILPPQYYSLDSEETILIPRGEFFGGVTVQLNEAFFNDPNAYKTHYVLPLKILSSSADSVLSGLAGVDSPDPRIGSDWTITPKNFTVFGIKFVNEYHGKYLHRGKSVIKDATGEVVHTIVYRKKYVEQDELWSLYTNGRKQVKLTGELRSIPESPGNFEMNLLFDNQGNCVISSTDNSNFSISGNGKFVKNGDMWGGKERDVIFLNYDVNEGENTHSISDTLVFRDKGVAFQEYSPVIMN